MPQIAETTSGRHELADQEDAHPQLAGRRQALAPKRGMNSSGAGTWCSFSEELVDHPSPYSIELQQLSLVES
jgi:hypothetical protein